MQTTEKNLRKEVKKYIDTADDKTVKMIYAMLEMEQQEDWWDKLPAKVQGDIDKALQDLDKGKGVSHEQVMKKYSKWFAK